MIEHDGSKFLSLCSCNELLCYGGIAVVSDPESEYLIVYQQTCQGERPMVHQLNAADVAELKSMLDWALERLHNDYAEEFMFSLSDPVGTHRDGEIIDVIRQAMMQAAQEITHE